ncbi:tetratricopeptide repeat protein [Bacteroidetes bacterium endosymbiont of Geopemphigus sp.]|uniref:tetratricopeptide repeat protein n=1 Tax=Bacteroidetes bacterium endosymbiont of Geopemphigus sp. TaxID=2047937 RepID=UPI000CD02430|nr:tetratricopeptide repeat protein [Bacteroidetes bacterium endosymbiont of Geopemphigus sp.]
MRQETFDNSLVRRFEEMIELNDAFYFDPGECVEIITHYIDVLDFEYAQKALLHAKMQHPYHLDIRIKEAEVLLIFDKFSEAIEIIDQLNNIIPYHNDLIIVQAKYWSFMGDSLKAIDFYKRALKESDEENYICNNIGNEYLGIQDITKALYYFKKALHKHLSDEYAFYSCLQCFEELRSFVECIDFLKQHIDRNPYSHIAWFQLGLKYFKIKDYKRALEAFDYALVINDTFLSAYTCKARCFEQLDNFTSAIKVYKEGLHLEDSPALAYFNIGLCYNRLELPIEALEAFQQSIHGDPQLDKPWFESALIYEQMRYHQKALYYIDRAIELNNDSLVYWKRAAYLNIRLRNYREAIVAYRKMLTLEPKNYHCWISSIELLIGTGRYIDAMDLIKKALKRFQKSGELNYYMSCCYFLIHQEEKGLTELDKAVSAAPRLCKKVMNKYPAVLKKSLVRKLLLKYHIL